MPETTSPTSRPADTQNADMLGRVVPHSIEAEVCVLGSMILDVNCIDIVVQKLKPEYFHRPANQIIFETLVVMHNSAKPIDLVAIKEELVREQKLETIGGVDYLAAMVEGVPGTANIDYYASIVRSKALLRQLIREANNIIDEAYDSTDEAESVIERAEQAVFHIGQQQIADEAVGLKGLLEETFTNLEETAGKSLTGLSTGYDRLNEMTAGFQDEEMIILAARPSMGKTALMLNIAEYMAVVDRVPIAFFSLEMSRMQITQRLLASHAQFNLRSLRRTAITSETWTHLQTAAGDLYDAPFYIDDSSMLTPIQLRAKARRLKAQYDIQCIFIDYLQLMTASGYGKSDKRYEQLGDISRGIKALARELKIPVVAAAQLNRGPADRPTHTPRMSDLRESGSIEQDADVVMLLHNEDYYHRGEEGYIPENRTHLIIEKQRNGPTGIVDLVFQPDFTRFVSAAPTYIEG